MHIQFSFALLCILSCLTAFATEMTQFTPEQRQILSRLSEDACSIPIRGLDEDAHFFFYDVLAKTVHTSIKQAAETGSLDNSTGMAIHFECHHPVVIDENAARVRVTARWGELMNIWFVTYFYFKDSLSLLIQKSRGAIVYPGSEELMFNEEICGFRERFFEIRRHKKYLKMFEGLFRIVGEKIAQSFDAMVLTSGGLQHKEVQAERVANGIKTENKEKTWSITILIMDDQTLKVMIVISGSHSHSWF
jgi:hypothetical protein